VKLTKIKK